MSPPATSRRWPGPRSRTIPSSTSKFYSQTSFTWGKTLGSGARHHPGQPQSAARPGAGRRRAQDRPHRRGRLRLHRIGRAERPPADHGRRRPRQLQPSGSSESVTADAVGLQRLAVEAACSRRARRSAAPRCSWAATARSALVAPRDLAVTIPAGVLSKVDAIKIRYQGPVKAPIAKGQHIADLVVTTTDGRAGDAAGRRRGGRRGGLLRRASGSASSSSSGWRERRWRGAVHQPRRRRGGRQVDPARRRLAEALQGPRARRSSSRANRAAAQAPKRSASCCWTGEETRWNARAEALLFAAARADHVEKMIQPALDRRRMGAVRPLPRQLARLSGRGRRAWDRGGARPPSLRQPRFPARPDAGADALDEGEGAGRGRATDTGRQRPDRRPPKAIMPRSTPAFRADRRRRSRSGSS